MRARAPLGRRFFARRSHTPSTPMTGLAPHRWSQHTIAFAAIMTIACRREGCGDANIHDAGSVVDGANSTINEVEFDMLFAHPMQYTDRRVRLRGYAIFGVVHRWVYPASSIQEHALQHVSLELSPEAEDWFLQQHLPLEGDVVVIGVARAPHVLSDVHVESFEPREPGVRMQLVEPTD